MQRTGFWRRLAPVAGIDPRALAAPRIGLGAVLLIDLWMRTGRFKALYTDAGVFPRLYLEPWMRHTLVPLHLLSGSVAWEAFLFAVAAVFAVALLLGYHARIAAVVSRQGTRTEREFLIAYNCAEGVVRWPADAVLPGERPSQAPRGAEARGAAPP
jgi:hypothetical protein